MLYTQNKKENLEAYNRIGIDTIRWVVPLKSFHKWILVNNYINLSLDESLKNNLKLLNRSIKEKLNKAKSTNTILYKIKNTNNRNSINSFIVAKFTEHTIAKSKKAKKNKYHFIEISINGIHQPSKQTAPKTYYFIDRLIKKYKIYNIDLACDNTFNKYEFKALSKKVKKYGVVREWKKTIYVNNPKFDNSNISRLIIYNKAKKENQDSKNKIYKKWVRIEATILVNKKIKSLNVLDIRNEVNFLYMMNDDIFKHSNNLNQIMLDTQVKVVSDLRSISKENNKYKEVLKLDLSQNTPVKHYDKFAKNRAYIKTHKNQDISLIKGQEDVYDIDRPLMYSFYTIRNPNNSNKIIVVSNNHRNKKIGIKKHSLPYIKRKFKIVFNI